MGKGFYAVHLSGTIDTLATVSKVGALTISGRDAVPEPGVVLASARSAQHDFDRQNDSSPSLRRFSALAEQVDCGPAHFLGWLAHYLKPQKSQLREARQSAVKLLCVKYKYNCRNTNFNAQLPGVERRPGSRLFQRRADFLKQCIAAYRLVQESRGSSLHHHIAQRRIPMGGHKYNRERVVRVD